MKSIGFSLLLMLMGFQAPSSDFGPEVGEKAPDFTLEDSEGKTYRLSDFQGKRAVVLEFFRSGSW